ncbi:hypothetical protein ACX9UE_000555 [Campylobacter upsaliensis]|uniref:hypothetical protein n=1 Tax=Campylobacter upsaliensis TaxID=28080 RepID=UPI0012C0F333|nr:hypothetical protein [Campylobacter upsaliensis]EAH5218168.1 hypothetical protein [Campylobacter upsaliensis]EAI4357457.1 hypothetical protein [Campylobacter upsaliensis]EAI8564879.1 hypothetical protein [Campylobacter upsaliensis]EAJ3733798.1 hypothetical protein [Campylobacter upsaliensis]EAW7618205.1 hypothetical protein [Campylobacter upsaliensis]
MQFSMKERDIYQLDRELEVNEKVFVTNKQGIDYTVSRKDNLYYVCSCSNGHTEKFDDIFEMEEYIEFEFLDDK